MQSNLGLYVPLKLMEENEGRGLPFDGVYLGMRRNSLPELPSYFHCL